MSSSTAVVPGPAERTFVALFLELTHHETRGTTGFVVFFFFMLRPLPPLYGMPHEIRFHPNIYNNGQICLDILQNQWSPIYDICAILTSIQSLLCDPNPASPANSEVSVKAFRDCRKTETVPFLFRGGRGRLSFKRER